MDDEKPGAEKMAHGGMIIIVTLIILACFAGVSVWVLLYGTDPTIRGSIIQTWNNLAIAAGTFWLGSSLGGKLSHRK